MYNQIIDKIKDLGEGIALVAGKVIDIGEKKEWLTKWDLKIENELSDLIKTFPGHHTIYAEEINDEFKDAENVWIIDPISNTLNFIHGLPHYSIVLSHLHRGEVIFAVVYDPAMQEIFTAEKGNGVFLNNKSIAVSKRMKDLVVCAGPHLMPSGMYKQQMLEVVKSLSVATEIGAVRTFGSLGIHYAYVACGRADIAISINKDVFPEFAGKLLVEEAGGKFTDFNGNELTIKTHGIVATNGKVHKDTLKLVVNVLN